MTTLVLLAHADPSVRAMYEQAAGDDVIVKPFVGVGTGMSARYDQMAARASARGMTPLDYTIKNYAPGIEHDHLLLAWFSGGYKLGWHVLDTPADRERLAGCVGIDGGHTQLEADGTASDDGVEPFVDFAAACKAPRGPLFLYGHSDVRTYGTIASTTQVGEEIERLAGGVGGGFQRRAYDVRQSDHDEHVAALREWGPLLVAEACERIRYRSRPWWGARLARYIVEAVDNLGQAVNDAARLPLGVRALELSRIEARTVKEATGKNDGPVSKYFAKTVRDTKGTPADWTDDARTGWAPGWEWCAASATECGWMAFEQDGKVGAPPPHARRISVREIVEDARTVGAWRTLGHGELPKLGDLAIFGRGGGDPTKGGIGHVGRVETEADAAGRYRSLDGNAGTAWGLRDRTLGDADLKGWVAYPA